MRDRLLRLLGLETTPWTFTMEDQGGTLVPRFRDDGKGCPLWLRVRDKHAAAADADTSEPEGDDG